MVFLISFSTSSFFSLKYKGNAASTRPVMTKLFLLALSSVSSLKFVYYALNWTYSVHTCEILHFKWRRINNVMVTLGGRGGIDRLVADDWTVWLYEISAAWAWSDNGTTHTLDPMASSLVSMMFITMLSKSIFPCKLSTQSLAVFTSWKRKQM